MRMRIQADNPQGFSAAEQALLKTLLTQLKNNGIQPVTLNVTPTSVMCDLQSNDAVPPLPIDQATQTALLS